MTPELIDQHEAQAFLMRNENQHFLHLGALLYDPLHSIVGLRQHGQLAALVLHVVHAGTLPDPRPTMMASATDPAALVYLMTHWDWPARSIWMCADQELRGQIERSLGVQHAPIRGTLCYADRKALDAPSSVLSGPTPTLPDVQIREILDRDADRLDLSPCILSPVSLRGWFARGWRVFGAVHAQRLLAHALAAYPIDSTDEVAAVYTNGQYRRLGLASAVSAAAIANIQQRGRRAIYLVSRSNYASRRLAEGLGMQLISQTWEILAQR